MYTVLLVIHLLIAIALIGLILFQRSSTDGLGSLSGGGNNVMSGRTQANLLTRSTAILATLFILVSLALGVMIKKERSNTFGAALENVQEAPQVPTDAAQDVAPAANDAPAADKAPVEKQAPAADAPAAKDAPATPAVPKDE
jgi:preprotein translocase subunit SecG